MGPYIIFLSLKPTKMNSDFILNYLKKVIGGATGGTYLDIQFLGNFQGKGKKVPQHTVSKKFH